MPLPDSGHRSLLHTRNIEMRGYRRDDGLFEIEGRVTDVKTESMKRLDGGREFLPGVPVHDMWVRLVVDEDLEVIEIRGRTNPYLSLPVGEVSFNLMKLISDAGLFLEIEKVIRQALKSGEPVREEGVPFVYGASVSELALEAVPLEARQKRSVLVLLEPSPRATDRESEPPTETPKDDIRERQISRLKDQLSLGNRRTPDLPRRKPEHYRGSAFGK